MKILNQPFPRTELTKNYEPQAFEAKIYDFWEKNQCFAAQDRNQPGQQAFAMLLPPPNVTGILHMGHALTNTLEDTLARWQRMRGANTLWLPGLDHAGIATQMQVEKQIAKEGVNAAGHPLTRHDLGRKRFTERTWEWKHQHAHEIQTQLKKLGSSLDWSRERFTLDEGSSRAVKEVFVRLYQQGLIYRGKRMIHWCMRCQTALSDLEVIPQERSGHLWHLRYAVVEQDGQPVLKADQTPEFVVIATTRPETLLGDAAVAIHPEDASVGGRYAHLVGKQLKVPLTGQLVPLILDAYVEREFGSGALKVTPAHDFNDAELGLRHGLAVTSVMTETGRMNEKSGVYAGLRIGQARKQILEDLKASGDWLETQPHLHQVGVCQRCETTVEPFLSEQWFVKIAPLAGPAIEAVRTQKIRFYPASWEKTYFAWMEQIRDWCISRQLWWGHQIPAWHCGGCRQVTVVSVTPEVCGHCGSGDLRQDPDVLDTWFSSALWPFVTLGWPESTAALQTFYPTAVLETGFDILFFWVARMIMMGIHFMGEVPFQRVYLHAMVRDEKGSKMSKSKGNVLDPIEVTETLGTDSLRLTLLLMAGQGRDIKLALPRVTEKKAFCNKLWNAVQFYLLQVQQWKANELAVSGAATGTSGVRLLTQPELLAWLALESQADAIENAWILSRLQKVTAQVADGLENFELHLSAAAIHDFVWYELCDWFLESVKTRKDHEPAAATVLGEASRPATRSKTLGLHLFRFLLEQVLRLLHPFIPFVTEELWQTLVAFDRTAAGLVEAQAHGQGSNVTLMLQPFPEVQQALINEQAERQMAVFQAWVEALRNFRGEHQISLKTELQGVVRTAEGSASQLLAQFHEKLQAVTRVKLAVQAKGGQAFGGSGVAGAEAVIAVLDPPTEFRIQLADLHLGEEKKRLARECERVQADLSHVRGKLQSEAFLAKAPPALIQQEQAKEQRLVLQSQELTAGLSRLEQVELIKPT